MKTTLSVALFLVVTSCSQPSFLQSDAVALSQPVIEVDDYFFTEGTQIQVSKTLGTSRVHYTTDGTIPTPQSPIAATDIQVNKSQTLTFSAFGGGFLPSEPVEVEVLKLPAQRLSLLSATPASSPYDQVPETALTDRAKAGKNFRETDWLGYQDSLLIFEFSLPDGPINGIAVSVLEDQSSWIFAPSAVKATFYDSAGDEIVTSQVDYPTEVEKSGSHFRFLRVITKEIRAARVRVEVVCLSRIPDWHPGAGKLGWVFLDEVVGGVR